MAYPQGNRFAVHTADDAQAWPWVFGLLSLIFSTAVVVVRLFTRMKKWAGSDWCLCKMDLSVGALWTSDRAADLYRSTCLRQGIRPHWKTRQWLTAKQVVVLPYWSILYDGLRNDLSTVQSKADAVRTRALAQASQNSRHMKTRSTTANRNAAIHRESSTSVYLRGGHAMFGGHSHCGIVEGAERPGVGGEHD